MFAAPECQTYSLAGANRGPRQTVSLALQTMFMLKALFQKIKIRFTDYFQQTGFASVSASLFL
jgi:hypothetical protein